MDERLRTLAKASPNFGRRYGLQPLLSIFGALAEAQVFTNPNASLVQSGQFGEVAWPRTPSANGSARRGTTARCPTNWAGR